MDVKELLSKMKVKFSSYIDGMNELDDRTIEEAISKYLSKLDETFDYKIDMSEIEEELNGIANDVTKKFGRKKSREEKNDDVKDSIDKKSESLEDDDKTASDYNNAIKALSSDIVSIIEDETRESKNHMESNLSEIFEAIKKPTLSYLVSKGYYNIDELSAELSSSVKSVISSQMSDYQLELGIDKSKVIGSMDDIADAKFDENEIEEKLGVSLKSIYGKYNKGDSKGEVTLAAGEDSELKVCMIEEPIIGFSDKPIKKGICVSKDVLENAIREGNENLLDDNERYIVVEQETYNMLITSEENDRIKEHNKNMQQKIDQSRAAKKDVKSQENAKEEVGYEGFL